MFRYFVYKHFLQNGNYSSQNIVEWSPKNVTILIYYCIVILIKIKCYHCSSVKKNESLKATLNYVTHML